jgi:hypothetical protein
MIMPSLRMIAYWWARKFPAVSSPSASLKCIHVRSFAFNNVSSSSEVLQDLSIYSLQQQVACFKSSWQKGPACWQPERSSKKRYRAGVLVVSECARSNFRLVIVAYQWPINQDKARLANLLAIVVRVHVHAAPACWSCKLGWLSSSVRD